MTNDDKTLDELQWATGGGMERFSTYRAPKGACDWCPSCGFLATCGSCRAPIGLPVVA